MEIVRDLDLGEHCRYYATKTESCNAADIYREGKGRIGNYGGDLPMQVSSSGRGGLEHFPRLTQAVSQRRTIGRCHS